MMQEHLYKILQIVQLRMYELGKYQKLAFSVVDEMLRCVEKD
jgi:hypothetical protein